MTKPKPPLTVTVTINLTLSAEAREAWCKSFGIENTNADLTADVKRYVGNELNPDVWKDIVGASIDVSWK